MKLRLLTPTGTRTLTVRPDPEHNGPWQRVHFRNWVADVTDLKLARWLIDKGYCALAESAAG
jgi:hypothetical protein